MPIPGGARCAAKHLGLEQMAKIKLSTQKVSGKHKKMSTRELRENLAEALKFTAGDEGKLVLTKNGEERAAMVSLKDLMILDALEDFRIKEVLMGRFDKKVIWSVLKDCLLSQDDGVGGRKVNQSSNGRARRTS